MSIDRQELTKIIESNGGKNWWQPALFKQNAKLLLPSELELVSALPQAEDNYNCFAFIFGLQHDPEFLGGKNPVQQEFVKHLILNNILVPVDKPRSNDLIFYWNEQDEITHGGIVIDNDKVLSKWMWGPIIKHELWDVPVSFGNKILFFKFSDNIDIKEKYFAYKNAGAYIKPIG